MCRRLLGNANNLFVRYIEIENLRITFDSLRASDAPK
jgi:hypothetical protein